MLRKLFAICVLGLALVGTAGAASVRPLQLDDIIDSSTVAFQGVCVANRTDRDAGTNLLVTYTTFSVKDVLKGEVQGTTHTIKQIGGKDLESGLVYRVDGVPNFVVGEEYVVLLAGVSSAGFSSPIGLAQGKFTVLQDAAGPKVSNGRDFREMTARMPAVLLPHSMTKALGDKPVHSIDLDEFKTLVRARGGKPQ